MPAGLADGFGSKEFAYAHFCAIHPGNLVVPPPRATRVRLYSVLDSDYRAGRKMSNIPGSSAPRIRLVTLPGRDLPNEGETFLNVNFDPSRWAFAGGRGGKRAGG